jgi:molybdopterin-synthase adenylyltransferase
MPSPPHRQSLLPQIGPAGQAAISHGHALIVGLGGLGSVAAEMLARAGVGTLTLVDRDVVDHSNLGRQVLYARADADEALPKPVAAARRIAQIDPHVRVRAHSSDVTRRNVLDLLAGGLAPDFDASDTGVPAAPPAVVLDCTDNFDARYLLNDAAVRLGLPLVYAGAVGTSGLAMTVAPGATACLRCVFETPPDLASPQRSATCDTVGVLGPAVAIMGNLQAAEAIKILAGRAAEVRRGIISIDAWTGAVRTIDATAARRPDCPCCGERRFEFLEGSNLPDSAALCGRDSVQVHPSAQGRVDLASLATRLASHGEFALTRFLLRGVLTPERGDEGAPVRLAVFPDGRAIISGVTRPERARAIYARYIGA